MCTNSQTDALNALHAPEGKKAEAAQTITVEYGPYMNWGRWNHNPTRVSEVVALLTKKGYAAQLRHVPKETTWENHGDVVLRDALGKELARGEAMQHNRQMANLRKKAQELVDAVAKLAEDASKEEKEKLAEDASTKASDEEEASGKGSDEGVVTPL